MDQPTGGITSNIAMAYFEDPLSPGYLGAQIQEFKASSVTQHNKSVCKKKMCKYKYWQVSFLFLYEPVNSVKCNKYKYTKAQWASQKLVHIRENIAQLVWNMDDAQNVISSKIAFFLSKKPNNESGSTSFRHTVCRYNIEQNVKRKSLKFLTPILLIMIDNYGVLTLIAWIHHAATFPLALKFSKSWLTYPQNFSCLKCVTINASCEVFILPHFQKHFELIHINWCIHFQLTCKCSKFFRYSDISGSNSFF